MVDRTSQEAEPEFSQQDLQSARLDRVRQDTCWMEVEEEI